MGGACSGTPLSTLFLRRRWLQEGRDKRGEEQCPLGSARRGCREKPLPPRGVELEHEHERPETQQVTADLVGAHHAQYIRGGPPASGPPSSPLFALFLS